MLQTHEIVPSPATLPAEQEDGRWPASGAAILVTALSLGLWALILVGARWLTG